MKELEDGGTMAQETEEVKSHRSLAPDMLHDFYLVVYFPAFVPAFQFTVLRMWTPGPSGSNRKYSMRFSTFKPEEDT